MEYCQEGSLRDHILKKLQHPLDYLIGNYCKEKILTCI